MEPKPRSDSWLQLGEAMASGDWLAESKEERLYKASLEALSIAHGYADMYSRSTARRIEEGIAAELEGRRPEIEKEICRRMTQHLGNAWQVGVAGMPMGYRCEQDPSSPSEVSPYGAVAKAVYEEERSKAFSKFWGSYYEEQVASLLRRHPGLPELRQLFEPDPVTHESRFSMEALWYGTLEGSVDPTYDEVNAVLWATSLASLYRWVGSLGTNSARAGVSSYMSTGSGVVAGDATILFDSGVVGIYTGMGSEAAIRASCSQFVNASTLGLDSVAMLSPLAKGVVNTLRPGPWAMEGIVANGTSRVFSTGLRTQIDWIGYQYGCHTCGSMSPLTASGSWTIDHQLPNALNPTGQLQILYPQCVRCMRIQGGQVRCAAGQ